MRKSSKPLLALLAGAAMSIVACDSNVVQPEGRLDGESAAEQAAPLVAAEGGGATVIKEFGCWLGPPEWGGPFALYTEDSHSVTTHSGNTTLKCDFDIPEGFAPHKTVRNSGFVCETFLGPTTESEAVATPGGNAKLSCTVHHLLWVNTTDDGNDGLCDDVHCSLREAIDASNALPGRNQIKFRIPGPGPYTIVPQAPLPPLVDPVTIDGSSQPGFAGAPIIELAGFGIGGPANGLVLQGGDATVRGLVINRWMSGIFIDGSSGNVVEGNYIGTDVSGTVPLGNGQGIVLRLALDNRVGGASATERNVISGNGGNGVAIFGSSGTRVLGNYIGTDATGAVPLGNGAVGVFVVDGQGNRVGGASAAARNVISANGIHGIELRGGGASGNVALGNYIGTDVTGTVPLGNGQRGVLINGAPGNTVGGTAAGAGNVISGNGSEGVAILGGPGGNAIQGNYIGTDVTGTAPLGNGVGVMIDHAPGNTVGGAEANAGNVISGQREHGVAIIASSGNAVQGNTIGTDATGTAPLGNGQDGVFIAGPPEAGEAFGNLIGGDVPGARNLISGNGNQGVEIAAPGSHDNAVQGNYIGTDVTGTAPLGNQGSGVALFAAHDNMVGGPTAAARNLLSANGREGVTIAEGPAMGNRVQGNYIGTDVTGSLALGNGGPGVIMVGGASWNTVGGAAPGAGNLISGNPLGIMIGEPPTMGNLVQGNSIGTDASGTAALPNGTGVVIHGHESMIGGPDPGAGNLISGNTDNGVTIEPPAAGNVLVGNRIGTDASGTLALANGGQGVSINESPNNRIGGPEPGSGNIVAFNGGAGIFLTGGAPGNGFLGNAVFANGGLGIDMGEPGVNPNDPGDGDGGPNDLQNFPDLSTATESSHTVTGSLNSFPFADFRIELFANGTCDPSDYGEGETFLGFVMVTTDGEGNAPFEVTFPAEVSLGTFVTATATALNQSTSEFSACISVTP